MASLIICINIFGEVLFTFLFIFMSFTKFSAGVSNLKLRFSNSILVLSFITKTGIYELKCLCEPNL